MPTKLQLLSELAEETAKRVTSSIENWTSFLITIGRLYKYPYHEQLMIYAQRPDATACAEYDLWNNTMNRYVRRGSKGIALLNVFDLLKGQKTALVACPPIALYNVIITEKGKTPRNLS